MFNWIKKTKEIIIKPSLYVKVNQYLAKNAPDILEKYEIRDFPSEILNSYITFENKYYQEMAFNNDDDSVIVYMRDILGLYVQRDTNSIQSIFTKVFYSLDIFEQDIEDNFNVLDAKIEQLRSIDNEIKHCFSEAKKYYDLLNDGVYNFTINCNLGEIDSISVVPGNFKKFFEYVKPQLTTDKEIAAYEEYCYQQFKLQSGKVDAFSPLTRIDLPKSWREELNEEVRLEYDQNYIAANAACKDVLDRIKNTIVTE